MTRVAAWIAVPVALVWPTVASAGTPPDNFTLGRLVPDSCFLYYHCVHNPAREPIARQWSRVWTALGRTGVLDEVRDLISGELTAEQRGAFDASWAQAIELGRAVEWRKLGAQEIAVAARMAPLPSVVVLCNGEPGSGAQNLAALVALLEHLASLDPSFTIVKQECAGNSVWSLRIPHAPVGVELFGRGDVIGVASSSFLSSEVTSLLAGQPCCRPIVESPRFREGLEPLPDPADAVFFLDWGQGFAGFRTLLDTAQGHTAGNPSAEAWFNFAVRLLDRLDVLDYTASVQWTEGWQERSQTVTRLRPDAAHKHLARIKAGRRPLDNPLAVVPKDADSCGASSGLDLEQFYGLLMAILEEDVPGGAEIAAAWSTMQEEIGFDIDEDVFSWLNGDLIGFKIRNPNEPNPLRQLDWVVMFGVADAELADRKVRAGLEWVQVPLRDHLRQYMTLTPALEVRAEGFQRITIPVMVLFLEPVVGVHDRRLIVASSEGAVNAYLDTADGKAPSFLENERYRTEAIQVPGPLQAVSFTDLRGQNQEMAQGFAQMGMIARVLPRERELLPTLATLRIMARLQPMFSEMDFLSSTATITTFDGSAWTTHSVVTYAPPGTENDRPD